MNSTEFTSSMATRSPLRTPRRIRFEATWLVRRSKSEYVKLVSPQTNAVRCPLRKARLVTH